MDRYLIIITTTTATATEKSQDDDADIDSASRTGGGRTVGWQCEWWTLAGGSGSDCGGGIDTASGCRLRR